MVSVVSLAVPILLSAILVFIASSLIHMVLPLHRTDFAKVPDEDRFMDAVRPFKIPPGDYVTPRPDSPAAFKDPAYLARRDKGPVLLMTVFPSGPVTMGGQLLLWFLYSIVISAFAAYVTSRAVPPGAEYLQVFRFAGTTAFLGYAMALPPQSIWYKRKWSSTLKSMFDGLVYALLTAGAFGWLWPD